MSSEPDYFYQYPPRRLRGQKGKAMKKGIELNVNNGGTVFLTQVSADGDVIVNRYDGEKMTYERAISAGDMVMLLNLYNYVKENNIYDDFINPSGAVKVN